MSDTIWFILIGILFAALGVLFVWLGQAAGIALLVTAVVRYNR